MAITVGRSTSWSDDFFLKDTKTEETRGLMSKMLSILTPPKEQELTSDDSAPASNDPADKFKKVLVNTVVRWASESFIESPVLIREMFRWGCLKFTAKINCFNFVQTILWKNVHSFLGTIATTKYLIYSKLKKKILSKNLLFIPSLNSICTPSIYASKESYMLSLQIYNRIH